MGKRALLILIMLILAANLCSALDVKMYKADFNIVGDKVVVEIGVIFNKEINDSVGFELPSDHEALSVYVDEELINHDVEGSVLKVDLDGNLALRFNYVTEEFIDKTNFLMNLKPGFDIDKLIIKLVLPEGGTLKKPIMEGDLTSGSIYPKPSRATTDGRSLIFYWERADFKEEDEMSIFTQIEPKRNISGLITAIIIIVIIAAVIIAYLSKKKSKTKVMVARTKKVEKEDMVEEHLKEEEEQIVKVLKLKEGSCEQGTLRIATGFSKASLSRLLKELEDRKVVYKEKRGKKNLVFLRK